MPTGDGTQDGWVKNRFLKDDCVDARTIEDGAVGADQLAFDVLVPSVALAAEAGDVIVATITVENTSGDAVEKVTSLLVELLDADAVAALSAAFTLTADTGTAVSTDVKAAMIVQTEADGTLDLSITDEGGASGLTVYLKITPLGAVGQVVYETVTFDGV